MAQNNDTEPLTYDLALSRNGPDVDSPDIRGIDASLVYCADRFEIAASDDSPNLDRGGIRGEYQKVWGQSAMAAWTWDGVSQAP